MLCSQWIKKNLVPDGFTDTNSQTDEYRVGAETSGK